MDLRLWTRRSKNSITNREFVTCLMQSMESGLSLTSSSRSSHHSRPALKFFLDES